MRLRSSLLCACLVLLAWTGPTAAQRAEYDFYASFRSWMMGLPQPERVDRAGVLERYRQRLTAEGVPATEIERRLTLIRTARESLESDFWNRFFTTDKGVFNAAPNEFLVSIVQGRAPGRALDVGMGEGRNTLYLAKLGWDVTGFDPADKAVALAQQRAKQLGLKITTHTVLDSAFDFGTEQWDLILYSWTRPSTPDAAARAIAGLKPGGIIVFEGGRGFFPPNGALEMFKALRILKYEDVPAVSDYFDREQMNVLRMVAVKEGR